MHAMASPLSVLESIRPLSDLDGFATVVQFLQYPDSHVHVGVAPNLIAAGTAERTWSIRLEISKRQDWPILGCEQLVAAISELSSNTVLTFTIVESNSGLACFWFIASTLQPIGFIVGDRRLFEQTSPE
jgi:hypothetical protein